MLAEHRRAVAVEAQHPGDRRGFRRIVSGIAGKRRCEVREVAIARIVMVAPGQQRRAAGRADAGGVEPVVALSHGRESVEIGSRHRPTEGAGHREADIIGHHDQHIGRTLRRADRMGRAGPGICKLLGDGPVERRRGDRQHAAVGLRQSAGGDEQGSKTCRQLDSLLHVSPPSSAPCLAAAFPRINKPLANRTPLRHIAAKNSGRPSARPARGNR